MFAFGTLGRGEPDLFCARDRFGIKPFYHARVGEPVPVRVGGEGLLPFLPGIATDTRALAEYLTFQYTIGAHTLFEGGRQLLPGHRLAVDPTECKSSGTGTCATRSTGSTRALLRFRLRELTEDSLRFTCAATFPSAATYRAESIRA